MRRKGPENNVESTPKTGFFITVCGAGLTCPDGSRETLGGVVDFKARLASMKDGPWWWSPHAWTNDRRATAGWEAASCIALDLDYSAAWTRDGRDFVRADHSEPLQSVRDQLDVALRRLPPALAKGAVLAHHTPRGARMVLLLKEPIGDRDLFVRAAAGADALVTGWLEAAGLLADTTPPSSYVVLSGTAMASPGYAVDHKAAVDLARVLWAPCATVPDKATGRAQKRAARVEEYGNPSERFDARWLASLAPASATVTLPNPPLPPLANWPTVEAALLRSPGSRAGKGKVEVRCPFHGPDATPSAVVFESGVLTCLASGCEANKGKRLERWAHTEGGRALLGNDLAAKLVPPEGRVRGETLRPFWRTVGEWSADGDGDWLEIAPRPMDWLLTVPPTKAFPEGRHVLPRGTVGMLAAGGGVGKSMALVQLAVAVATETAWLVGDVEGAFPGFITHNPTGGKVLLALGEENAIKARRRLYQAALRLDPSERELLRDRLVVLPLEAVPVGLMADRNARAGEEARAGDIADELERLLAESGPWALVILDPLSRFAGMETETDNAAATRFVQVLERFTKAPGAPTVLVSHHTGKVARTDGTHDATASRGSSALTDGARWVATLTKESPPRQEGATEPDSTPPMLKMSVTKNNYGLELWPFWLSRGDGGQLRCATRLEIERATAKAKAAPKATRASDSWGEP